MKKKYLLILSCLLLLLTDCRCQHNDLVVNKIILEIPENILKHTENIKVDIKNILGDAIDNNKEISINKDRPELGILKIAFLFPRPDVASEAMLVAHLQLNDGHERLAFADIALDKISNLEADEFKEAINQALSYLRKQLVGEKIEVPAYLTKLEQAANGEAVDSAILTSAITLAGEDPLSKEAGKYLIDILKSTENLGVANACLMALAQRKDPSALQAIIDFSEGKPALIRRQAILAVRQIPSQLSKEWLVVMAYGHSDPQVRKEALEALNNLEKQPRENK